MPVVITKVLNLEETVFSHFIIDYHGAIIQRIRKFHRKLGVIGFDDPNLVDHEWAIVRVTNRDQQTIEIIISLQKLWIYGYRCAVAEGESPNPWLLVDDYGVHGFSGLDGPIKMLKFDGKYKSFVQTMTISKDSFENAVTTLYYYGQKLKSDITPGAPEIKRARRSFLMMVLYFAESLRILPIRSCIEEGFDSKMPISIGQENYSLAKNWSSISKAFFTRDFSRTRVYSIHNEDEARKILSLLLCSNNNEYVLDGNPPPDLEVDGDN